jgi:hypothetical protein
VPDGADGLETLFCGDHELGYLRSRTQFIAHEGLALDDIYRLAHLPLVAPFHPRVIARREGTPYEKGRHEPIFSLVLPVPGEALRLSPAYGELTRELEASPFARKIAWNLLDRREKRLHATLCGALAVGEKPPLLDPDQRRALAGLGPLNVELRGLFSGNINLGRLYLRAYPERRNGINMFQRVQEVLDRPKTDLYLVGVYNLTDDLDATEASALASIIERWWARPILRFQATGLWLLGARDDLVLDSLIVEKLAFA